MSIFFDQYYNTGVGDTPFGFGGEELGFFDAMGAAYEAQIRGSNIDTYTDLMREELQPLVDAISERQGLTFSNPGRFFGASDSRGHSDRSRAQALEKLFTHLDENRELYPEFSELSRSTLDARIKEQALAAIEAGEEARSRETTMGKVGGFLGQGGGVFTDQAFLDQMVMMGPMAFMRHKGLGQAMLAEGLIGAGTEAILQPGVREWYQSLGLDYSYEQMLINIGIGGVIGAGLPPVLMGAGKGVAMTTDQVRKGLELFRGNGIPAREADLAIDALDDFDALTTDIPETFTAPDEATPAQIKLVEDLNNNVDDAVLMDNEAIRQADAALKAIPETVNAPDYGSVKWDTERTFNDPRTGDTFTGYQKAIQRLYDDARVLGYVDDKLPVPDAPSQFDKRAVVILGPPAAGKSSIANPIARRYGAAIIDPDEAKKLLPEFNDGAGATAVHEESGFLAEVVMAKALDEGVNMVIPKVGGKPGSIQRIIKKLKANGYRVDLVGMDVSYINARNRMFMRFLNTGRYIPLEYIKEVGDGPMNTYNILKKEGLADGYTHIDNNGQRGQPKPVIEDTGQLLEGVDLQLRASGPEDSGLRGQPGGASPDEEVARQVERLFDHLNRADEATANLDRGLLPDEPLDPPDTRPLPQETTFQEAEVPNTIEQVARDTDFDNMPDDETLTIDMVAGDEVVPVEMTGRQIKAELAQDERMLDRLRGCVV